MDQILKGLYRLGVREFPSYLVVGSHLVVQVDAGTTFPGPQVIQDIQEVLGQHPLSQAALSGDKNRRQRNVRQAVLPGQDGESHSGSQSGAGSAK